MDDGNDLLLREIQNTDQLYMMGEESHNLYWKEVTKYKMMGLSPLNVDGKFESYIFKVEYQNAAAAIKKQYPVSQTMETKFR